MLQAEEVGAIERTVDAGHIHDCQFCILNLFPKSLLEERWEDWSLSMKA